MYVYKCVTPNGRYRVTMRDHGDPTHTLGLEPTTIIILFQSCGVWDLGVVLDYPLIPVGGCPNRSG